MKRWMMVVGVVGAVGCTPKPSTTASLPPVRMVSPDSADHQSARFSPDGSRLFWWQPAGIARELWMSDTTFKSPVQLHITSVLSGGLAPLWSPDGRQIAVTAGDTGHGVSSIVVMAPDGSDQRRLPLGTGFFVPVGWNRDGDRFAYTTPSGGAFTTLQTSITRGGSALMTPGETRPAWAIWSPDGAHIAYQLNDHGQNTIWVADSNGHNARQLTKDGFESFGPADTPWSPDSREIAFESRRTGMSDIWVAPIDGSAPRQLTRDVLNDTWPVWSPDSKWIAFLSDRGKQTDLWAVPAAGGTELRVTDDAMAEEPMQWLAGTHQFAYLTGRSTSGVWRMSLKDSSEQRLTPDSMLATTPILSPDGQQVAFIVDHGGGVRDIDLVPAAGGAIRTLVNGGADSSVSWSPDGKRLVFTSDRGGTPDIWVVDAASGSLTQLDNWPGTESAPVWSGDGSTVYFISDHDSRGQDAWRVAANGGVPVRVTTMATASNLVTQRGGNGVYLAVVGKGGQFQTMRVGSNGQLIPVWTRGNSLPVHVLPAGDSLIVAETRPGGGITFRLIAADGKGDGHELLQPGEATEFVSRDGKTVMYDVQNGSTNDIGVLDRTTGASRRLTNTSEDEDYAQIGPDGNTIVFSRARPIRRVAVADLTEMLKRAAAATSSH